MKVRSDVRDEQPPIGGICSDCGHFAMRHNPEGCIGVKGPCSCTGMLWNDKRWPRPWLPAPEGQEGADES